MIQTNPAVELKILHTVVNRETIYDCTASAHVY